MNLRTTALSLASILFLHLPFATAQQGIQAATVVVPSGTLVPLNLVNAIKHKSTKPGDTVRAKVAFPITVGDQIAIPAGTVVEGQVAAPTKGKKPANQPPVLVHFTKLVYANGYTVSLDAIDTATLKLPAIPLAQPTTTLAQLDPPRPHGPSADVDWMAAPDPEPQYPTPTPPTVTDPYAHAGPTTKELIAFSVGPVAFIGAILLAAHFIGPHGDYIVEDAGWQFQMTLQSSLPVDVARVNAAAATAP